MMKPLTAGKAALVICLFALYACDVVHSPHPALLRAEQVMNEHPDSASMLLDSIHTSTLSGKDYADWCLLITQARDKKYIVHTSDSLIRVACEYYEAHPDPERLMLSYYYMGRVNQVLGDALRAQEYFLKALRHSEISDNIALKARICTNLGMLYTKQELFDAGLEYQLKGLDYLRQVNDTVSQSFVLRDIGRTYKRLDSLDVAICYYQQALQYPHPYIHTSILSEMGGLLADKKEYQHSLIHIHEAINVMIDPSDEPHVLLTLGRVYREMGQKDSAYYYLYKVTHSPNISIQATANYQLIKLLRDDKRWEEYADREDTYDSLRNIILKQTSTESIQRAQSLYNYDHVEKEAELAKKEHEDSQQKYRISVIVIIVLIILFFLSHYIFRIKRKEWHTQALMLQKLRNEQEEKSEQQLAKDRERIQELEKLLSGSQDEVNKLDLELEQGQLKAKAEETKKSHEQKDYLLKLFQRTDIYIKVNSISNKMEAKQLTNAEWDTFIQSIDNIFPNLHGQVRSINPHISIVLEEMCYLIRVGIKQAVVTHKYGVKHSYLSTNSKRLFERYSGKPGSAEDFKALILTFY